MEQKIVARGPRKGAREVREWNTMDPSKDGCPCVIKRRFTYWQTNLKRFADAEKALKEYRAKTRRTARVLKKLEDKVTRAAERAEFSAQTLRNSVRYARARITPGSDDYKQLARQCPHCKTDTKTSSLTHPFVTAYLENGKSELRCIFCFNKEPATKYRFNVKRRPLGRSNQKFHKELMYYDRELDNFFLAKRAAAGCTGSNEAMKKLVSLTQRTINHFKFKSAREVDDAAQQGMLGLLEAAKKFDPAESNMAKFTTYASFWIRRRAQARKSSHCRPGLAMAGGKHIGVTSMESAGSSNDGEGAGDFFHPAAEAADTGLRMDIDAALSKIDDQAREMLLANTYHGMTLAKLAEKYGYTPAQVRNILVKAKAVLAEELSAHAH